MGIKISKVTNPSDYEKMYPNFIYNRYDLFCNKDEYRVIKLKNNGEEKIIEYRIMGEQVELGLWLMPITVEELETLVAYIAKKHKEVKKVSYKNGVLGYGRYKRHNHFRIIFPDTVEEMEKCISSKSRSKMRKKLRFAEEDYGTMKYLEYEKENIPLEIVEKFFEFKYTTRNRVYKMTAQEYLDRYHVSHCYVLMFGDTVGAVRFACEQCPVVYGENFAYNPEMQDYSLGRAIFFHHLIRMVQKKHTELFFAGGEFEYKKHYGSIEETLFDCNIAIERESNAQKIQKLKDKLKAKLKPDFKHDLKIKLKQKIKKILPKKLLKILWKIKQKFKK